MSKFKELFAKDMKAALGNSNFEIIPDALETHKDSVVMTYLVDSGNKKFNPKKIAGKTIKLTNLSKDALLTRLGAAPAAQIKAVFVMSNAEKAYQINLSGRTKGGVDFMKDETDGVDAGTPDYFQLLTESDLAEFDDIEKGLVLGLTGRTKGGGGAKKGKKEKKGEKSGGGDGGDDDDEPEGKTIRDRINDWLDSKKEGLNAILENPEEFLIEQLENLGGKKKKKKKKKKDPQAKSGSKPKNNDKKALKKVSTDPKGNPLRKYITPKGGKCNISGVKCPAGTDVWGA